MVLPIGNINKGDIFMKHHNRQNGISPPSSVVLKSPDTISHHISNNSSDGALLFKQGYMIKRKPNIKKLLKEEGNETKRNGWKTRPIR